MLEFEIAAIYYFIDSVIPSAHPYFEEVPMDMLTPCVFYPTPNFDGVRFSVSSYDTEFVIYIKFIDVSTSAACEMAASVLQEIMTNRKKIPLVDENGKKTGKNLTINDAGVKRIDNGVYQLELSWDRYSRYKSNAGTLAREFFFNGKKVN